MKFQLKKKKITFPKFLVLKRAFQSLIGRQEKKKPNIIEVIKKDDNLQLNISYLFPKSYFTCIFQFSQ